ncbi:MAG: class I SAM-dependent methyltransferase, partial [Pseudomonadota bacterium]
MSHAEQVKLIEEISNSLTDYFSNTKVLEIGSMDINGSVRRFFRDCDYVGVDLEEGPGVDHVAAGQVLDFPSDSFDVVFSCECFEHNPYWRETLANMVRMCRPGGLIIVSCGGLGRAEHGTARSEPGNSPATINQGWNYYGNISPRKLSKSIALNWWSDDWLWVLTIRTWIL